MEDLYKKYLIESEDFIKIISKPVEELKNVRIIEGTNFPPLNPKNKIEEFKIKRIPYSQFFDMDVIAELPHKIPHMMPSNEVFIEHMKKLDVRKSDHVIIYDRSGMFSAPRVWLMFYWFGHRNIQILNGSMIEYEKLGGKIEIGDDYGFKKIVREEPKEDDFNYEKDETKIVNLEFILKNSFDENLAKKFYFLDARNEERFNGTAPEPRKGIRTGHINGAKCIFFKWLITDDYKYKSIDELKKLFDEKGVDINNDEDKTYICSCGTGLTACIVIFGLTLLGKYEKCKLYDGSWTEYGSYSEEQIEEMKNKLI